MLFCTITIIIKATGIETRNNEMYLLHRDIVFSSLELPTKLNKKPRAINGKIGISSIYIPNPAKADRESIAGIHNIAHITIRQNAIIVQMNEALTGNEEHLGQACRMRFMSPPAPRLRLL
jgi:hypothetical protein|tara:strand:- start:1 stop:360 length:360 start_codon:yes stop_codon:yes gene_type:complete